MKAASLSANQNAADSAGVGKENAVQLCDWWTLLNLTEVE
jgi:hypothetical protein